MASTASVCTSSPPRQSPKEARFPAIQLAAALARQVGMVATWPNIQTIRLAIESEAEFSAVTVAQAATLIASAAQEISRGPEYSCLSSWEQHQLRKANDVDRFWFEDARWRTKPGYWQWLEKLQAGARE